MNRRLLLAGMILGALVLLVLSAGWRFISSINSASTKVQALPNPVEISNLFKEDQVNVIRLRPEAVNRLGLKTRPIEKRFVRQSRVYGGEITIPPGKIFLVAAPLSGLLRAPETGVPSPGQTLAKGQVVLLLLPLLTPEGQANLASMRIDAEGQVRTAQTRLDAARVALARAERVFKGEAGSKKTVDEMQAQYDIARKSLDAANQRFQMLDNTGGEAAEGLGVPIPLESPGDGVLRNLSAAPGQRVPSGGSLFEFVDLSRVWVRVPVFVGDMSAIDPAVNVRVGDLALRPNPENRTGTPAVAPPSANMAAGTVDLFFELDNRDRRFVPGERVGVTVPLKAEQEDLVIPWSAIIHDSYGGTWVYEEIAERSFSRRRVVLSFVDAADAIISVGPNAGTKVVTEGAAELFGAETGFTK